MRPMFSVAAKWLRRFIAYRANRYDRVRTPRFIGVLALLIATMSHSASAADSGQALRTQNVILVVLDGLRWQEVFFGGDPLLMNKDQGVVDVEALKRDFGQSTQEGRREALMPFFWKTIQQKGQLFGNQDKECVVQVLNGLNFSYPGYNEILTGIADPAIRSNDKIPNPNVTVWEWLNKKPAFHGQVAAFGTWDAFPAIFNRDRSQMPIFGGFEPVHQGAPGPRQELLDSLIATAPRLWSDCTFDAFYNQAVLEYLRLEHPRVLFVGFGETDEWAHSGRYDMLLRSIHSVDAYIQGIWDMVQVSPWYRDRTTILVTADHGRGRGLTEWRNHGEKVAGSEFTWLAAMGPDTPALGERSNTQTVNASQFAATISTLLGQDYRKDYPAAGEPIKALIHPERLMPRAPL